MSSKVKILNTLQIRQKLDRLAYEVYEDNYGEKQLLVVGIEGNGYKVAASLADKLKEISKIKIQLGKIKIDKEEPWKGDPVTDFSEKDFVNKTVVLVDDVLNSGKTLMYAVKLFLDKPVKKLSTVILVDRSHTRFPVKADFVGLTLSTTLQERIEADLSKKGSEAVYLI
ncbi:MAG: Pyrimidine regulatory protein PyrR [Bacteroidetes bacterium]|jgi:pyrimidine operon attenuation protein/uracil phosphoribosyltransferase|nr:Pyrimidine regulatory protein PyrR [Bacteroidota bacterium]